MIDASRRTPLYYAVEKGYTKIVQTLLEYDTYMEVLWLGYIHDLFCMM